jgi:hypothetical protein
VGTAVGTAAGAGVGFAAGAAAGLIAPNVGSSAVGRGVGVPRVNFCSAGSRQIGALCYTGSSWWPSGTMDTRCPGSHPREQNGLCYRACPPDHPVEAGPLCWDR